MLTWVDLVQTMGQNRNGAGLRLGQGASVGRAINTDRQTADDRQSVCDQVFGKPLRISQPLTAGTSGPYDADGGLAEQVHIPFEKEPVDRWSSLIGMRRQVGLVDGNDF